MKKLMALLLTTCILVSALASCGSGGGTSSDTAVTEAQAGEETTAASEYSYPEVNYEGYEFRVLNLAEAWNTYIHLDFENLTGEGLDDAVYNRNRSVESRYNFVWKELEHPYTGWSTVQKELISLVETSVLAGTDDYDAAYLSVYWKNGIVTEGYLCDLRSIPELQLDEKWWDTNIISLLTVNDKCMTASSPLNLNTIGLCDVLLFNETMMKRYGLDYPYQLVRDGKWTLDKFSEYVKGAAQLNGDAGWAYTEEGNCIYGIAGHSDMPIAYVCGAGNTLTKRTADGLFELSVENDNFYNAFDKVSAIFTTSDGSVRFNNGDTKTPGGYLHIFNNGRSMFITCEMKAALELRQMEDSFGLLPTPKMDEKQDDHLTVVSYNSFLLTMPITQKDTARAGIILDTQSYESYKTVFPEYSEKTLTQKGLRNDDSIEMLALINESLTIEFCQVMGVTTALTAAINSLITGEKGPGVASTIAQHKEKIIADMQTVYDSMK